MSKQNQRINLRGVGCWLASLYPHLSLKVRQQLLVAGVVAALMVAPAGASPRLSQTILGNDFQINSYPTNEQSRPDVAADSNGNFVVVWQSQGSDGNDTSGFSIQGQRYNSTGVAQGSQFQINSYTNLSQTDPAVAMDNDGDFVVVWQGPSAVDDFWDGIVGQRYNSLGMPQGSEFQVNSYTSDAQNYPDVAMDSNGDFVVVWNSYHADGGDAYDYSIQGQRFNSLGETQGSQFQVNSCTANFQRFPAVAASDDGDFVVVWQGACYTDDYTVNGQRFSNDGIPQGNELYISTDTGDQKFPDVAMDSNGDFVVAWHGYRYSGDDSYDYNIHAQRYNRFGIAQGSSFQVNTETSSHVQYRPAVAMDNSGDFVIAWESLSGDHHGYSIQNRLFSDNGLPLRDEVRVNQYTYNHQIRPGVAIDQDGDFVVVWQSDGSNGSDHSGYSIQGQQQTLGGLDHQANSYTSNGQFFPAIAGDNDGNFVVVWQSIGSDGNDNSDSSIQARLYANNGQPQANQFQVNSYTPNDQSYPNVAMDNDGDFVVVWQSYGSDDDDNFCASIQGQRYDSLGAVQGSQFQANTQTTGCQYFPDVAMDNNGNFVVVWDSAPTDPDFHSIQGQRYNSLGMAQGSQFQVSYGAERERFPTVSMDDDGDFVVGWQSHNNIGGGYTDYGSIQGQRYNSLGTAQGSQFQVNSYTPTYQGYPSVAMDRDGDFVVVWQSGTAIQGQRYNDGGTAQGNQFQINAPYYQIGPAVILNNEGDFLVVWGSGGSDGNDNSFTSIQGRHYDSAGDPVGNPFQINHFTTGNQNRPAVTVDGDGDFMVAWENDNANPGQSPESDNDLWIAVRRVAPAGNPPPTAIQQKLATIHENGSTALAVFVTALVGLVSGLWLLVTGRRTAKSQ